MACLGRYPVLVPSICTYASLLCAYCGSAYAQPFAYVANFNSSSVSVIDTQSDTLVATVPVGAFPGGVSVHPDGSRAFVANFDSDNVSVIDTATNTVVETITGLVRPNKIAFTPRGDRAFVSQNTIPGYIAIIDTETNIVTGQIGTGMLPNWMAMSPDGAYLYVVNTWDTSEDNPCQLTTRCLLSVSRIDTATHVENRRRVGIRLREITVSPDGTTLYVAGTPLEGMSNGAVYVVRSENLQTTYVSVEAARGLVLHPDGNPLYISAVFNKVLRMDTETRRVTDAIHLDTRARTAAVTPDGQKLYVIDDFPIGVVAVVDLITSNVLTTLRVGDNPVAIAVGPGTTQSTPVATPTLAPTETPPSCAGDCSSDSIVTVDEIVTMVNVALGYVAPAACPAGDGDADGRITVDEIQHAVTLAVEGCA